MTRACMTTPDEVSHRAQTRFDRAARTWAASAFLQAARPDECPDDRRRISTDPGLPLSVSLHPPVEQQVMGDIAHAQSWVSAWRECRFADLVEWTNRRWPSVGTQSVPGRVIMRTPEDVARVAGCSTTWITMRDRACDVSSRWHRTWRKIHPGATAESIADAVSTTAQQSATLSPSDWRTMLDVIDWLAAHAQDIAYARQLPIRGIDTKWVERHRALLKPLCRAVTGRDPIFAQPQRCVRVNILDDVIALDGIVDLATPVSELDTVMRRARLAIICENLVSTLSLPPIPGTIALHGGGYAVGELGSVSALSSMPLLYWGDLDSNGFAILNELRSVLPHAESILMDRETLAHHLDLCVNEPAPNTGRLANLTTDEQATLDMLRQGNPSQGIASLRLEQERIEWAWACSDILAAASRYNA